MNLMLAIQSSVIVSAVVVFLLVVLLLVAVLLYAKKKLTPSGEVTIDINEGEKQLKVEPGQTLLTALGSNKIFLPSACGGGGDRKSTRLNSSHVRISYA